MKINQIPSYEIIRRTERFRKNKNVRKIISVRALTKSEIFEYFLYREFISFHPFFCILCCVISCASVLYVYLVVVVVLIAIHVSKYLLCIKDVNLRDIDLSLFLAIYFEKAHFIILAHAMYFLLFTFYFLLLRT